MNRTRFSLRKELFRKWRYQGVLSAIVSAEIAYVVRALSNIAPMGRQSAAERINHYISMGFLFTLGSF